MTKKQNNDSAAQAIAGISTPESPIQGIRSLVPEGFQEKLTGQKTASKERKESTKQGAKSTKSSRSQKASRGEARKDVQQTAEKPQSQSRTRKAAAQAEPTAVQSGRKKTADGTKQSDSRKRQQKAASGNVLSKADMIRQEIEKVAGNDKKVQRSRKQGASRAKKAKKQMLRIISLGGLGEIGKNITVYETEKDLIIVDCGMAFPDGDLLGVDLVIPDFSYLVNNQEKIRGIFITHGHEDHIGSIPYLMKQIKAPIYSTALTLGLINGKLREHGLEKKVEMRKVSAGDTVSAGDFSVEFIHVNHSIPDACALAINTPAGMIVQTGDFKIDYTPLQGEPIDLARFAQLGQQGVLALLPDSTNAEKPGYTPSEQIVADSFQKLFASAAGRRIIVATFSSNIYRIQQIIDTAAKTGRKVAVFGRSMLNVINIAGELGYLNVAPGLIIELEQMRQYTDDQLLILCTGSQGEPMSALSRMSLGEHRKVRIGPQDFIILSASPIPGNEKLVGRVVNDLMKLGAEVVYEKMYDVHVSGHACQDEIKTLINLTRPKYFMPMHGEYKHLMKNARLAQSIGMSPDQIIISDIGKVVETDGERMAVNGTVPSGRVLVDGLGVGDVGNVVLRDRKILSEEGLIIAVAAVDSASGELVSGPDLISRGFVYVRESEELMKDACKVVAQVLEECQGMPFHDWVSIKGKVRDALSDYIFARTKRKPMILPVLQEV